MCVFLLTSLIVIANFIIIISAVVEIRVASMRLQRAASFDRLTRLKRNKWPPISPESAHCELAHTHTQRCPSSV